MDLREIEGRSRTVWGMGDYAPTARQLEPVSVALVDTLGVASGHRVLDVAAGTGNGAIAAARRGATVVASDFSPVMVEHGRRRTRTEGLAIEWREADAADLPFPDGAFDRVTSVFGAIFAPEPEVAARELVRVTAPGGVVGLTAWTPDGVIGRLLRDLGPAEPPTHDAPPGPLAWGDPAHVERLLADAGDLAIVRRTVTFAYDSWDQWRRDFEAHGMSVVLRDTLPRDEYESLLAAAKDLVAGAARTDGGRVAYDAEYLEIRVDVPA